VPADGNRGSKRTAARRRIEEKRAAEAAARAQAERRRRTVIGGVTAAVLVVLALVVVVVVQTHRTSTSASAAVPAHTIDNGMVVPVAATSTGSTGAAAATSSATKPVVVDLYEDLQCPICRQFEATDGSTLAQLVASGSVVLHYHPMAFLDSSANDNFSTRALNAAAVVLNTAGTQAFQKFHDLIYTNQTPETGPAMTDAQLISYAEQAGATGAQVSDAIKNLTYEDWTKKVTEQASKNGVTGTPTVFIGGKELSNAPTATPADVTAAVQSAQNS
jgi:protein-disulfide isomerase